MTKTNKKYYSQIQAFVFLLVLFFVSSCNGQVKKDLVQDTIGDPKLIADGQPKLVRNLGSLKDPGHNVNCSLQDIAGNLWFGTSGDGLYKYDGKLFTQFTTSDGMNSNNVGCILEDKSGKIWIGSGDGICIYDDQKFSKIQVIVANDTITRQYNVWSIMQDSKGKIWFATSIGIYICDGASFSFFEMPEVVEFCTMKIEKIVEDIDGNIWLGGRCHDGVYRYDGKTLKKFELEKLYDEGSTPRDRNWALPHMQDKDGNIWFSNWDGVYRYDGKSFTSFTKKDGLSGNMVATIKQDSKGNIWLGGDGLTRYNGKTFTRFTKNDGLLNTSIWSILEDNTGALWIGTRETTLHRFNGKTFTSYTEPRGFRIPDF
jgi:ligand-binding sensor domain-containing protein